jgi:hypothetical protein
VRSPYDYNPITASRSDTETSDRGAVQPRMDRGRTARLRVGQLPSCIRSCGGRGARDDARGRCAGTGPIREADRYPEEALVTQAT